MASIYKYLNYRDFLRDVFVEQKQLQHPLTHRAVLQKMRITSTGFLSNVIAGKKNLTREMGGKLGKVLRLARREQKYFAFMVSYTQAKSLDILMERVQEAITLCLEVEEPSANQFVGVQRVTVAV